MWEFIVIILLVIYSAWKDHLHKEEREKLQLKWMAKDISEYKGAVEPPAKPEKKKPEPEYEELYNVPIDTLMKAQDNL